MVGGGIGRGLDGDDQVVGRATTRSLAVAASISGRSNPASRRIPLLASVAITTAASPIPGSWVSSRAVSIRVTES